MLVPCPRRRAARRSRTCTTRYVLGAILVAVSVVSAVTQLPPRADRYVHDTAGVIDDAAERELEQRNQELFQRAGVAIVVITVPRLVDETIDEFAVRAG